SATWAWARRSRSPAARTRCGPRAACSTRRLFAEGDALTHHRTETKPPPARAAVFIWAVACRHAAVDTRFRETENLGGPMHNTIVARAAGLAAITASSTAMAGKDLDAIKGRGAINCGVGIGTAGFSLGGSQGKWGGRAGGVGRRGRGG